MTDNNKKKSIQEFSASIKEKYPQYKDIDDEVLVNKMIEKYPVYKEQVDLKKKEATQVSSQDTQESSEQLGQPSSPQINGDEQKPVEFTDSEKATTEPVGLYAPGTEPKEPYKSPQPEEGIQEQELGVIDLTPTQLQAKLKQDIANEDPLMKSALESGSITPIEAAIQVKAQKQKIDETLTKQREEEKAQAELDKKIAEKPFIDKIGSYAATFDQAVLGFPGEMLKGAGILSTGIAKQIGFEDAKTEDDILFKIGDYWSNKAKELFPSDPDLQNEIPTMVAKALGDLTTMYGGGLAGQLGKTAGKIGVKQTSKGLVKELAKKTGQTLKEPGTAIGAVQMSVPEFEQAIAEGATDEQAFEVFMKNAVTGSILERLPVQNFLKRFNDATKGGLVNVLKRGTVGGLEEGVTEVIQGMYANKTANDVYGATRDILDGATEGGGIGFGLGFVINALGGRLRAVKDNYKGEDAAKIDEAIKLVEEKKAQLESELNKLEEQPQTDEAISEVDKTKEIKQGEEVAPKEVISQEAMADETTQLETQKQETDAVQEPSTSEVDVQPETKTSEEVVEGTSETKPQEVAKESGTEQKGVQIEEQTKATEPTTDVEQEVKTESTRLAPKSEYTYSTGNSTVKIEGDRLEVVNNKTGKTVDPKTEKKVLNEYKEKIDYLSGETGRIEGQVDAFNEDQADTEILSSTSNPGELIDIVVKRRGFAGDKLVAVAGTPEGRIAQALSEMSVERDSFVRFSDNNQVDRSIAMQYIDKKGKGSKIDVIAQAADVSPQDVVDFIEKNRGGIRRWELDQLNDDVSNAAEKRFEEITGLKIDDKVIEEYNKQLNESFDIKDDIEQIKNTEYAPDQYQEYLESTYGQTESIDSRGEVDVESETLSSTDKGRETKEENVTPPSPPKSETKQVKEGGDKIYNNEAIFTGKKGKREQTIEPELTEEGKIKESISRESIDEEVARIINNNSKEDVDTVVRDKSNDMLPALRSGLLTQLAKNAKKDGDNTKAGEYFDLLAEVGTESAQEMSLRSDFSNDPEIVTLQVIRDNNKKKDSFRNNNNTTDGKTVGEHVDNSLSELKDIAAKLGLEVSDLQSVEKLIEKIVAKKISQLSSEKVKVSQAKIKKARAERKKITEEFKNKKDQLFYSSLIPGLTPEGVMFFGKIAKTYINEGVANTEILLEKLKQYARENFDVELSDADLEKIKEKYFSNEVKETIEDYKAEIKDIINDHYSKKDDLKRSLAEKIKDRLDLSESEAKKIESLVNSEFKNMMKEEGMKELTKVYGTTKIPKKEQKKKKDDLDKIIEAYNMGAFDDNLFRDLIAEKFGYRILTDADIAIIDKYSNDIQELPPGELRNRKIQDLQTELYKIKDKTKAEEIGNTLLELFYISTLSGLSTVSRALKGGVLTSSYDIAVSALTNPRIIRQSMGALMRGMNQYGLDGWWSIMKDGYSDVEFFEVKPKHRSKLEEITNKSFKELSKEDKKIAKMGVKAFLHVPVRVYRLLIANDAVMKAGLSEMHSYIEAYNNELLQGETNRKEKEFWTKLNKKLAIDERSKKKAETAAEQEIEALIEKGEKIPFGYKKRRVQELINEIRNQNYENNTKIALEKANSALLMNDPVGTLGSLYRFIQEGVNIKETDNKAQVIGKVLTRVIVSPFIRVATNFVNTGIDYAPGLSFVRLAKRVQGGVKKRDGYVKLTPKEKIEAAAKASIGLTISLMLTADMYDEDEDGNLIIDEDAGIQVTGEGPGTYSEGLSVAPDYKKYSFRFKNPLTNEWSSWYSYLDNPLGLMLAPHGTISDQISFKRFKKEVQGKDIYDGLGYTSLMNPFYMVDFAGSQTYSQGITSLTTILFGKGDLDKRIEASTDIITRPARGIMLPNLYKQTYQQYKSFTGKPQKLTSGYDRLIKDLPLLEDILSGTEYDQFGNPIVRDFEIPLVPDVMLDGLKSNRRYREGKSEWKAVYDFPEVNLGRTWKPLDKVNGKELTNEEKSKYLKLRGDIFKENFNKNIEKLKKIDNYNAIEVQKVIDKLKIKATKEAKKQMFSDK